VRQVGRLLVIGMVLLSMNVIARGGQSVSDKQTVLVPVQNDPTISFRIWFRAGSQNDPAGKEGLAFVTASMLTEGATTSRSYEEVLAALYPLAADYRSQTHVEQTIIAGRVHKDNLDKFYPLFTDAILHPAFEREDLDRIKSQTLNYLQNSLRYSSDEELGKAALYHFLYQGTPYGHEPYGTVQSIESIALEDVRAFYQRYYTEPNVVIGVGGGYQSSLVQRLQQDLGQLPDHTVQQPGPPQPRPIHGKQVLLVEKEANATAISIGFPIDILRGSREWYALALANSWFGEHRNSSSHLYQVIREDRGLNYGDYSYIERYPNGGSRTKPPQNVSLRRQLFEIWIRPVPNDTRHFVLRATVRELQRMVEHGLSEEDFEITRQFFSKYVLHYAPTTMARLGYALDDVFYHVDGSHLENLRTITPDLTREEVNRAIRKYLQFENMKIAIVTPDAESFKEALISDEPSPIQYSTPKSEEVLDEDKLIMEYPLHIKAADVRIVPVEEMFEE